MNERSHGKAGRGATLRGVGRLVALRIPADEVVAKRAGVAVAMVTGGALAVASGIIHLHLRATGYRSIPTIGTLFLLQGIGGILVGAGVLVARRLGVALAGAGYMAASIAGLIVSTQVKLFGFHDSFAAPYAGLSLGIEIAGLALLAAAAALIGAQRRPIPSLPALAHPSCSDGSPDLLPTPIPIRPRPTTWAPTGSPSWKFSS
jgi:hypothetical protein